MLSIEKEETHAFTDINVNIQPFSMKTNTLFIYKHIQFYSLFIVSPIEMDLIYIYIV
jgi:hypothetical protein